MAVGSPLPQSSSRPSDSDGFAGQVVKYDRYIETQLHRTRRQVKGVDLAGSLLLLAVVSLAYLMLVALVDHWVVSGGLGFAGRLVAFGLLAAGVLAFAVLRLVPLIMRRVNPVYAAYTIERHRPGIKNSLINFLLLRSGSERLPERVYEAMEVQAVNALSATNTDVAVDRAPVIRWLLAMVAILVGMAFYTVLSPKNPFTSFRRIISPWANVAPPTRVAIEDVQPGDGSGFHDQHVMVTAVVKGLRSAEEVTLRYSTRDGQVVDKPLRMALAENGYRHAVELPPDNLGLQQDLEYRIEAGDAISPSYKIRVDTAPTIALQEIEYKYPGYSELPPRKVARHGDIQALDGTRVTLRAKANQPIGQAHLDFECDGRNDLQMKVEGTRAEVSFSLEWNEKTRRPEHTSYQLRFRNDEGHENPKPIRYAIEVIPDLAPEVEFVEPELDPTKDLVVPPRKPVRFVLEAADPDFKLTSVTFHARSHGVSLVHDSLLAAPRGGSLHRDYLLDLKPLDLKPGDQVEFWASSDDNRQPKANHSETPHYHLRVATGNEKDQRPDENAANPEKKQGEKGGESGKKQPGGERNEDNQKGNQGQAGDKQKQDGQAKQGKQSQEQGQPGNQSDDDKSSGGKNQSGTSGKKSSSSQASGEKSGEGNSDSSEGAEGAGQKRSGQPKQGGEQGEGEKSDEPKRVDPERDAGKAIEEINKHFNQKEKENQSQKENQPGQDDQASAGKAGQKNEQQNSPAKEQDHDSQGGDSQDSDSQSQTQKSEGGGKSGKQSSEKNGGSSGGQEADGSEKQPAGKQPAGKDAGKPSDGKGSRGGESQQDKSAQRQNKTAKKGEQNRFAEKKDEQQQSEGARGDKADQADDSQGGAHEGEKQAGKSGKQPSSGEKGAEGGEPGTPNEGGDKTMKDASGGSKQGNAKKGDEGAKHADQETRPRDGQGGQARGAGETDDKMKKHKEESPDQKGGDPDSRDKGSGGAGNSEGGNKHGAPTTHGGNQGREKKQLSPDNKKGTTDDEPESSSEDKRQSDSQGAEQGEHDGGGKSGGGQRANNEGTGAAGQNSEADQGGQQGQTQGEGPTGTKGGQQQKADKPTGGKSSGEKGPGTNRGQGQDSDRGIKADSPETADPRGHTNESRQPTQQKANDQQPPTEKHAGAKKRQPRQDNASQPQAKQQAEGEPTPSERGGNDLRGGKQRTNPTSGGLPGADDQTTAPPPEADESEPGGEEANQEYARKATDLALERLKDELAKDKPDPELLKKLEWTREDIERFVEQWDRLKRGTDEAGPKGDEARQEFDDALRSLGLRPRGASLSGGTKRDDRQHNLRQDRRIAPPPEYQEQWYEYKKSLNKTSQR